MTLGNVLRVAGMLAMLALLVWFGTHVDWGTIWSSLKRAAMIPLLLAVVANLISFALKGVRWWVFLRAIGVPSLSLALRAVFFGAALNNALVANAGEAARVIFVAKVAGVHSAPVLATLALERFFDIMGYMVMLVVAMLAFPLPDSLAVYRPWAFAALVVMTGFVIFLSRQSVGVSTSASTQRQGRRWVVALKEYVREFSVSVRELSTPGRFVAALALSLGAWVLIVATFAWGAEALGAPLSFAGNVAVTLAVSVGFLLRFTPGNVGVFQVTYALTAVQFGMEREMAVAVALMIQAVQILPVTLIGFVVGPQVVLRGSRNRETGTGRGA